MGAREPFGAKVRDRTESVASLSVIAATRPGTRPVVSTTGSSVVAMSCGLADGRQEPRHVALEASDQPILQPIGGIAKQAGFAERRYSDQLHGSDARLAFVSDLSLMSLCDLLSTYCRTLEPRLTRDSV